MIPINKKFIVDEQGNPKEVIILFEDFKKIEELLGLDLDENAIKDLKAARKDSNRIAEILGTAFLDDPVLNYIMPNSRLNAPYSKTIFQKNYCRHRHCNLKKKG